MPRTSSSREGGNWHRNAGSRHAGRGDLAGPARWRQTPREPREKAGPVIRELTQTPEWSRFVKHAAKQAGSIGARGADSVTALLDRRFVELFDPHDDSRPNVS